MNHSKLISLLIFFCILHSLCAQEIRGVVVDIETNEPLPGASVYYNNTTVGTITNDQGEFTIAYHKELTSQLIISFVGYETAALENYFYKDELKIRLTESTDMLNEVQLTTGDNWPREIMLEEFKKHFLGQSNRSVNCELLNEEEIYFKYNKDKMTLSAYANGPIMIQNNDLKYLISVDLSRFKVTYSHVSKNKKRLYMKLVSYAGMNQFIDMEKNSNQFISKKRDSAYLGSTLHFMRSLAKIELEDQHYNIYINNQQVKSSKLISVGATGMKNGVKVRINEKLNVVYDGERRSTVDCNTQIFYIDSYGNHSPSESVIFTGDLGNQRMGDALPLDFKSVIP